MKRFALITCLAACLVFAFGATAMGSSVTVASGSSGTGASVTIGVFLQNDGDLRGLVVPLVFRSQSGGAYPASITGRYNTAARLEGTLSDVNVTNGYDTEDGSCKQGQPGGFGTIEGPNGGPPDFAYTMASPDDPDALLFSRNKIFAPNLTAGDDGATPSILLDVTLGPQVGQFCIDTTCANPANHLLFVLASGAPDPALTFTAGCWDQLPDQCPSTPTAASDPVNAVVGTGASNQISSTDPDGTPGGVLYCVVAGPGSVSASGLWSYTPTCQDVPGFSVTIGVGDAANTCPCDQVTFQVNVAPTPLSITNCGDVTVHWGDLASKQIGVSGGCPPYLYAGGAPGSVDAAGLWTYQTSCQDLGTVGVSVSITDDVGQNGACNFNLTVTNDPPTCTNPADITVPNDGLEYVVVLGPASQADGDALTYNQTSGPSWGSIVGNEWRGTRDGGDDAEYLVCFTVTDGCETSAECCFTAKFESPYVVCFSEPTDDKVAPGPIPYVYTLGGRNAEICIWVDPATGSSKGVGGFDFLVCYDQSGLTFLEARRGEDLHPDWEYFTWRTGMFGGNCGGACPNGFVRLVGITDMNNGITPDPAAFTLGGNIVCLEFFVTADVNFVGSCLHVGFCSYDCGDNVISSKDGNTLFLGISGATLGVDYEIEECLEAKPDHFAEPFIIFCQGAICIIPPPDDRGDINLNGIANEIGDAVLFSNYFIYGPSVWDPVWFETQIFATDINNDGITLTIADLVYLIRIITGDEQPFPDPHENPKVSPYANSVDVLTDVKGDAMTVRTNASVDLGGALLVYRYSNMTVGEAALTAGSGLKMKTRANNGELRILVYPDVAAQDSRVPAGLNDLVTIPVEGEGTIELVESQFSDNEGGLLSVQAAKLSPPKSYALHQNFPNPFNAGTVIPVTLKDAGEWTITVYNVAGQVVKTFAGNDEVGTVNVRWDGRGENGEEVASGMYFYRATAGDFTATKKMVLLK